MKTMLVSCWSLFFLSAAFGNIIRVPTDITTVPDAITAASEGDTVLLERGTHTAQARILVGINLVLASDFILTGDTSAITETILESPSAQVIGILGEQDSTTIIAGLTITGGRDYAGGGISCLDGSPVIRDNVIMQNEANSGGGIYCSNASPRILRNVIRNNTDYSPIGNPGGGICMMNGSAGEIAFNVITENENQDGGGIACVDSDPWIHHNVIAHNTAFDLGGGIRCDNSNPLLVNNVLADNAAGTQGGGMFINLGSNPVVVNCILWGNTAGGSANQIEIGSGAPVLSYCDVQGGWTGSGNIQADPLFRDAAGGDFHLSSMDCGQTEQSPCVDAGDPALLDSSDGCRLGLGWSIADMGAFGGAGDSVETGVCVPELPTDSGLCFAYPNPFNATTTITFSLPRSSDVTLTVFDVTGRVVVNDLLTELNAGTHNYSLVADALPSGVYFAQVRATNLRFTTRLVLLK